MSRWLLLLLAGSTIACQETLSAFLRFPAGFLLILHGHYQTGIEKCRTSPHPNASKRTRRTFLAFPRGPSIRSPVSNRCASLAFSPPLYSRWLSCVGSSQGTRGSPCCTDSADRSSRTGPRRQLGFTSCDRVGTVYRRPGGDGRLLGFQGLCLHESRQRRERPGRIGSLAHRLGQPARALLDVFAHCPV